MANNTRDISLTIRAKSEADRAFKEAATAADSFGTNVAQLESKLTKLEGTENRTAKTLKDVGQALETQAQKLGGISQAAETARARLGEIPTILEALKRTSAADYSGTDKFAGSAKEARTQIAALEREYKQLQTSLSGTTKRPGGLDAQLTKEVESYRLLRQEQVNLRDAQTSVRSAIDATTEAIIRQDNALKSQSARSALLAERNAAERNAARMAEASQLAFNTRAAPGLTRAPNTSADRSAIAATLRTADLADEAKALKAAADAHAAFEARVKQGAAEITAALTAEAAAARELEKGMEGAALRNAAAAHAAFEARVKQGAAEMRGAEAAAAAEATELERLKAVLNPTAAAETRLAAEQQKLNKWFKDGKISAQEYATALKLVEQDAKRAATANTGLDSRGRPSLFGLKPYELQNLSFQINDVFTQIASGTSVSQTLAQQGGQILQLFPKVGSAVAAGLTSGPILAFTAAIGLMAVGIAEAFNQAEKLRNIQGFLTFNADGARTTTTALMGVTKELDRYGLSAEEAMTITKQFFRAGLDSDQIIRYGRAAKDLADVMGVDLKDATNQVAEAFTGGYAALEKFMSSTQAFTPAQRQQIRDLYEQGKAAEGAALAFDIFSSKANEAAKQARGPWSEAFKALGNAWDDLTTQMGNTWWAKAALSAVNGIADAMAYLAGNTRDAAQAERERQGIAGGSGAINPSNDPLASAMGTGDAYYRSQGLAVPTARPATGEQASRALDMNAELDRQVALQKKITSEAILQDRLKARRVELELQIGNTMEAQDRSAYIQKVLDSERVPLQEQLTQYLKQQAAEKERALAAAKREREAAITQFTGQVVAAEGGSAKNPFSSAQGNGQFINSTWIDQFRKVYADQASKLTEEQILALRQNETIAKGIIDNYARENAKFLEGFGARVTAGNLYLAHFLGPAGAKKILTANPNTPVDQLLGADVMNGNKGYLRTENGKGRARTAGELQTFIGNRVGDNSNPQVAGQVAVNNAIDASIKKQADFNEAVAAENLKRQQTADLAQRQLGLQDLALLNEEKIQFIEEAVNAQKAKAAKEELQYTAEQEAATRKVADAQFEATRGAKERANIARQTVDKPVADLTAQRDQLQSAITGYQQTGQTGLANDLMPQLAAVNEQLRTATNQALEFYRALTPGTQAFPGTQSELDMIILKLQTAQAQTQQFGFFMGIAGQQISQTFASTATSAIDKFAQAVAGGANVFKSLGEAFRQFASDFLRQLAQMIIQQQIFNLVSGLISSIGGSAAGGLGGGGSANGFGAVGGMMAHSGGVIGKPSTYGFNTGPRSVSPAWFTAAARYHTGGIAGLRPDEVPAILQKGEEVLTADDPRHRANGGAGGGGAGNIKIVNAIDGGELMSQALNTKVGERALVNWMRQNSSAIRSAMG